ncbi:MAG: LamG domain-containing protein [Verrucomicrobiales bacterium]|nr:LamG domain-containing protein [Verrucomicrobiales bacterium]
MIRFSCSLVTLLFLALQSPALAEFKAGSAITDVTPKTLPVLVNGSMVSRSVDKVKTPVSARSLAFTDEKETIVLVVVDSCMVPRDLCDKAKGLAAAKADIKPENILISATHTHTAPSCMGALGTDADPAYVLFLTKKLVDAILTPLKEMKPAQIGWGEIDAGEYTALRRWVIHPDHVQEDPFGNPTVRANMHAGRDREISVGKTGPEDPMLSLISIQSTDGEPIGLLSNFSMHYYGDRDISADYFGLFSNGLQDRIAQGKEGFVAMMSHGCSGDIWRQDYEKSTERDPDSTIENFSEGMIDLGMSAYESIQYHRPESIAMMETRMTLDYRTPDKQLLQWSQKIVEELGENLPKTKEEIYAREQVILHEKQNTEIVVQALRLGEKISITTTPNETYAITGLKIKGASPTEHTMVIELANGGDGYIPPPEQHLIGGYNTWAARSAGLEVTAEPKIVETSLAMLEDLTGKGRMNTAQEHGPAAEYTLSLNPTAYWRLDEFTGPRALDSSGNGLDALFEPQTLFYLQGPHHSAFSKGEKNRAVHVADARISARIPDLTDRNYTISMWFWSGSAPGKIDKTEWLFSRGRNFADRNSGDHVGLIDSADGKRYLVYEGKGFLRNPIGDPGRPESLFPVERWKWHHLAVAREGDTSHIFLDGVHLIAQTKNTAEEGHPDTFFFGGPCTNKDFFEGRLDEIAVFDRAISSDKIKQIYKKAAGASPEVK